MLFLYNNSRNKTRSGDNSDNSGTENDCWYLAEEELTGPTDFIADEINNEVVSVHQIQSDAVDKTKNHSISSVLIANEKANAMVNNTKDKISTVEIPSLENNEPVSEANITSAQFTLQNNFDPFRRLPNLPFNGRPRSMSVGNRSSIQSAPIRQRRRSSCCLAIPTLQTIPEELDFGDDIEQLFN